MHINRHVTLVYSAGLADMVNLTMFQQLNETLVTLITGLGLRLALLADPGRWEELTTFIWEPAKLRSSPSEFILTTGEPAQQIIPDVPRRLALSNFEHLVSLSSEHRTHRQTDS